MLKAGKGFVDEKTGEVLVERNAEIDEGQVEAVRATGAPFLSVVVMGVLPQVMARFIGFSAYQLDSNLRNSALGDPFVRLLRFCGLAKSVKQVSLKATTAERWLPSREV